MRRILIVLAAIFIGACGGSNQSSEGQAVSNNPDTESAVSVDLRCPVQEREGFIQDATGILEKFTDTYTLASSTSRIALSPIVGEMQAMKREMDALDPTDCGELVKLHLVDGMDTIVNGFLAFMQQKESDASRLLLQGESTLEKGMAELVIIRGDPGYGLRPTATPTLIPPTRTPTPTRTPVPTPTRVPEPDGVCHHPSEVESLVQRGVNPSAVPALRRSVTGGRLSTRSRRVTDPARAREVHRYLRRAVLG